MGIMTSSGACLIKAGEGVSDVFTTGTTFGLTCDAQWEVLILQAESVINDLTRYNWSDAYATLNSDVKYILEELSSNLAAMYAVIYNTDGYGRSNAELKLDVLNDAIQRGLSILRKQKHKDFINGA